VAAPRRASPSAGQPAAAGAGGLAHRRIGDAAALLIVDMISGWDFPDAAALLAQAARAAPRIASLGERCRRRGLPVIYANDNRGQWRSDFPRLVREAMAQGGAGERIARLFEPAPNDYFVLKPKHSAFFDTPLELLLRHLEVRHLVVSGVSSDQCVLHTVADARMRDFQVQVPADCVATQSAARNRWAIRYFREVMGVSTVDSGRVRLRAASTG
jgi:nicotinamidase-related amidase